MTTPPEPRPFKLYGPDGQLIMSGAMNTCMEHIPDSRARNQLLSEVRQMRADAAEAQATQIRAHASAVHAFCDSVNQLSHRLDALELRHADRMRHDAARKRAEEAKAIADYLDSLPNPDDPQAYEGELTTHPPSHTRDKEELRASTGDSDNEGDLPPDLTRSVPATPGNYAWPPLDQPAKQVPQRISVQLNEV
jgi:hypothetical protein